MLDLGCGRGEFLALCRQAGISARGFDTNERSVADLKQRGFDVALSQVTITKDRAKVVSFTTPYFNSDQGVLVKKGTKVTSSNAKAQPARSAASAATAR